METIKNIVSKLDVLLSQVLIESVIMDVSLGKSLEFRRFGGAESQNIIKYSSTNVMQNMLAPVAMNNGPSFL